MYGRTPSGHRPKRLAVDEPLTELAAYFRRKSEMPGQELVRLTAAARAGGSPWGAIAAACGVQTDKDIAGVVSPAMWAGLQRVPDLPGFVR